MKIKGLGLAFCGLAMSLQVQALSPIGEQQGWGGFVMGGGGYTRVKSNTVAGNDLIDGGKQSISSIYQSPRESSASHGIVSGELRYTLADRNEIFLGTALEDFLTLDFGSQLGWRKQTQDAGIFQLGYLFTGLPPEVWEDPYLVGEQRKSVDRESSGARFVWDRIFGSQFELTAQYRDIDIGTDRSGSDPSLGCDARCQSSLDRNGEQFQLWLSYTHMIGKQHIFRPQLRYRREDRDGSAVSRDSYGLQISYSYLSPPWIWVANAIYGKSDFDEANPLYGIRQDADSLAFDATVLYRLPIEGGRWQAMGTIFWGETDSDINFHDDEIRSLMFGVMYHFGNQSGAR